MIKKDFGSIIANKRKDRKLSQPQLAALLCERGLDVKAHSISKWEKNVNLPNVLQFFALCEILEISDINRTFQIGTDEKLFSKLNDEGQAKALDYMNLLGNTFEKNQSFINFHEELSVSMISRFQLEQDNSLIPTVFPKLKLVMKYLPVLTSVSGYVVTAWSLSIWMDRSSGFINKKHLKKEKSVSSSLMVMLM